MHNTAMRSLFFEILFWFVTTNGINGQITAETIDIDKEIKILDEQYKNKDISCSCVFESLKAVNKQNLPSGQADENLKKVVLNDFITHLGGKLALNAQPKINILQIGLGVVGGVGLTSLGFFLLRDRTIKDDYNSSKKKIKDQWVEVQNETKKKYNEINS